MLFASCNGNNDAVVNKVFIDSIINDNKLSNLQQINDEELRFAKQRLDSLPGGLIDAQKYAGALAGRFHLYGDITALRSADSIMRWINQQNVEKDAAPLRTLAYYSILQHRFSLANNYVQKALSLGSEKYISELLNFDVAFEKGQYTLAKNILQRIKSTNEYGYFFRLSKYQHWMGEMDSSINSLKKASELAGSNTRLMQTAISNLADLYMHAAEVEKANYLYMQSILLDKSDLHSLMGLGWIALIHDKNDSLAERILKFVRSKTTSPEPLLMLMYVAQQRRDTIAEKQYAQEFVLMVSDSVYGDMYNKYLVDIYSTTLNNPGKAVAIAEKELKNRCTPQTCSWLVWSLFKNEEKDRAMRVYEEHISGKPLEGLELYYMGIIMKEMKQGYNAEQYLDAAWQNRFDLSPAKASLLKSMLDR